MASRRLARSAVDWGKFGERIPGTQKEYFRAFKAKSEAFVTRVHQNPENLPKIDFSHYRARVSIPGLVDKMEKGYADLKINYPVDKQNLKTIVDQESKDADIQAKEIKEQALKIRADAQSLFEKIDSLPGPDEMTAEMYGDYFPEGKLDPENNPTFWPHTPEWQPSNPEMMTLGMKKK